jgi:hypothetical protein
MLSIRRADASPRRFALPHLRRNMAAIMDWKRYIPDHAVTTVPVLAAMIAVHFLLLRDDAPESGIEPVSGAPMYYHHWQRPGEETGFDIDGEIARLELSDEKRDRLIRRFLHQGKYGMARTLLLEVAAAAVLHQDQALLGDTLMLLGEVAINQQELSAAEIYLQEALYLAMSQDSVLATARCYQLLGQLNIRARELARRAANTYDQLWQARNSIARGQYRGVGDNLQAVIDENLAIRRYGAAADAWEALASLHDRVYDGYQAQQARIEAARLYASTGQMTHVHRLLDLLDRDLFSDNQMANVEAEMKRLFEAHERELVTASQARDYQMLYHHYLRLGQLERAWNFRIKASETLAETGDRAMYRRQTDVIAVLYNSNFAIDRAKQFLDRASNLYRNGGAEEMLAQTRDLESLIY